MFNVTKWGLKHWLAAFLLVLFALMPLTGDLFYTSFFNRMIIMAIAVASLNLILGYGGMISLGHAAFLGIGAYSVGIPAYYDIYNGWLHLLIALFFSGLFALITGAISLRTRGVYFIMITMAFSQMAFFAFVSVEEYGGDDGLVINSRSEFWPLGSLDSNITLYYVSLVALVATIFGIHRLVNARFGGVIQGARANERRMRAIGHNTYAYQLTCYVLSGMIAGVAGALIANHQSFISPDLLHWIHSGEFIFMVILGGMGTLFGPIFGTALFLFLQEYLSRPVLYQFITSNIDFLSDARPWVYWHLPFGILLILVVLYARGGLDGLLTRRGAKNA